jgi:aminopeptidase N
VLCVGAAVVVGLVASLGSALLVLASGALLGTIALLWASVRTLSGDAPLPVDLEALAARRHGMDDLGEQKTRLLRALKDLETEHALGKIDDADYGAIVARYRDETKAVMRQMDLEVAPLREAAERVAREYLDKRGVATTAEPVASSEPTAPVDARPTCASCRTSNDPDAAFCKKCGSAMKDTASVEKTDAAK